MIEVEVAGDSNNLGPNKKHHWRSRNRLLQQWREKAHVIARNAMANGHAKAPEGRVRIAFVVRRGRRLDPDNAASSLALKGIVDGLRDAGLLADDTEQYCERGSVIQEVSKEYRQRPSVVVKLEPLEK